MAATDAGSDSRPFSESGAARAGAAAAVWISYTTLRKRRRRLQPGHHHARD